jgi:hypothetical protein
MSCHQPHNAQELVWKPADAPEGYKLLRLSPSGSVRGNGNGHLAQEGLEEYEWAAGKLTIVDDVSVGSGSIVISGNPNSGHGNETDPGDPGYCGPGVSVQLMSYEPKDDDAGESLVIESVVAGPGSYYTVTFETTLTQSYQGSASGQSGYGNTWNQTILVSDMRIKVPEDELSASSTGWSGANQGEGVQLTTYNKWKGADQTGSKYRSTALSAWCADCHNLNIGYPEALSTNFRGGEGQQSHSDRTHTSGTDRTQCYICHRSDLPTPAMSEGVATADLTVSLSQGAVPADDVSSLSCKCHLQPSTYESVREISDWPHAGRSESAKLLKDRVGLTGAGIVLDGSEEATYSPGTGSGIDSICTDCHDNMGERM